jgi:Holliday junction resolvase-like predicted endonuclease
LEGVTLPKQRKLTRVAESYLKFKQRADQKARFDVVAVVFENEISRKIELVQNAFEIQ